MASRIAEVVYKLRDLFTGPAKRVGSGYDEIRRSSRQTADSVENDNRRMGGSFTALSGSIKTAIGAIGGLFAGGAAVQSVGDLANELDRLGKTADRLKLDPNTLSAFEFALERSGVAADRATDSLQELQQRTGEAIKGTGEAKEGFAALGIELKDFINLRVEDRLYVIADRLQAVANEEERAVVQAQLFGEANAELEQALRGGSVGLRNLIEQGKEYRNVTREATQAAAAYKDALSNLNRQVEGIKFDAFTPVIRELSEFLDNIGQGDQIKGLTAELLLLEERLGKAFVFDRRGVERRVDEIRSILRRLSNEREAAAQASEAETAAAAASADEHEEVARRLEALNEQQRDRVKTLRETLRAETAEREAALRAQARIEEEFRKLREDVSKPDGAEEVTLGDVSLRQRQAAAALERGEAEAAITLSREAGEMLRKLKEDGDEAQLHLNYFAKAIETTAKAAAAQNTEKEIVDAEEIRQQVQLAEGHLSHLTDVMKAEGGKAGRAFAEEFARVIQQTTLPAPAVEAPVIPLPEVVQRGIDDYRRQIEKQGVK